MAVEETVFRSDMSASNMGLTDISTVLLVTLIKHAVDIPITNIVVENEGAIRAVVKEFNFNR